ncbi:rhodanese-like domain-containing protein [Streptomyces sp. NPDC048389]|uniref:rhodanese-like domain-containing protein n=1 Tax=Streptomyces sp. NPDC048389 TaxID=3154622 RepID=UPI003454C5B1
MSRTSPCSPPTTPVWLPRRGELTDRIGELPEDTEVVVHCRGECCALAHDAVRLFTDHGRQAIRLNDGMLEWRLADLPVHGGATA